MHGDVDDQCRRPLQPELLERLQATPDNVDRCDFDPGHPEYASVEGDLRTLSMVWRADLSWPEAPRSGRGEVAGPAAPVSSRPSGRPA